MIYWRKDAYMTSPCEMSPLSPISASNTTDFASFDHEISCKLSVLLFILISIQIKCSILVMSC